MKYNKINNGNIIINTYLVFILVPSRAPKILEIPWVIDVRGFSVTHNKLLSIIPEFMLMGDSRWALTALEWGPVPRETNHAIRGLNLSATHPNYPGGWTVRKENWSPRSNDLINHAYELELHKTLNKGVQNAPLADRVVHHKLHKDRKKLLRTLLDLVL